MAREAVIITNSNGDTATGQSEDVARYSSAARIAIASLWIIGGFLGAFIFIIVPVVHLITTWALPLGGILLGIRAFKRHLVIYQVSGTCPVCHESIDLVGGSVDDRAWQVCPKCKTQLRVRPER